MPWYYIVGAVILYFIFQEKIRKIRKWIEKNKDKIDGWMKDPEIKAAYEELKKAVEAASFDCKWSPTEIILVLNLGIKLFSLIKKFEEK